LMIGQKYELNNNRSNADSNVALVRAVIWLPRMPRRLLP
jgi:hypothetical protein